MAQGRKSDTIKNVLFFCGGGIVSFSYLSFQMRRDVAKRYKTSNREHKKVAFDDSSQNLSVEC